MHPDYLTQLWTFLLAAAIVSTPIAIGVWLKRRSDRLGSRERRQ